MGKSSALIWQIALDTPLYRLFDYLPPLGHSTRTPPAGIRVRVPFGRRLLVGLLVAVAAESTIPSGKLKHAIEALDTAPVFDAVTLQMIRWSAAYYHHPLGEVIAAALPAKIRAGQATFEAVHSWTISEAGRRELDAPAKRASRRRTTLAWLAARDGATLEEVPSSIKPAQLDALVTRGWAIATPGFRAPTLPSLPSDIALTDAQAAAVAAAAGSLGKFAAHLLYGVTGSGKTEVYLRAIAAVVAGGGQALVLVPEIALTPQLVQRFRARFSAGVVVLHSGLTESDRRRAWRYAHNGLARIVIGTRSAVFTSLPRLELIVVDEEHDASYKQHEGFHYSARDLAVWRARRAGVPVILGSATPSLETLQNVARGRYCKWTLPTRPGSALPPRMQLVDMRRHAQEQGVSEPAIHAMKRHLSAGGQVIVFLNRRGYAPTLFCTVCGWVAPCARCDARMTLHLRAGQLRCHHCGAQTPIPQICSNCTNALHAVGQGTERVEETLARLFPDVAQARLDRDTAAARGAAEAVLTRVQSGAARILIGTQMLTKGHHFPEVSLVIILEADQGLFATDYRATERLAQVITQVAGRAGRAARPGEVLIQTQFPEHPLLHRLIVEGYEGFAASALEERRAAAWPPFSRLAMLRAEARDQQGLDDFLRAAADCGRSPDSSVRILGPASALLARRADHYRAHLLLESASRSALQKFLGGWLERVSVLRGPSGLRWSIDVDPLEVD